MESEVIIMAQNSKEEKKFFIIEKDKYSWATDYKIHDRKMYDLTTATKKLLALETLNERDETTYHLQEVNFSLVEQPLILSDEETDKLKQQSLGF